MTMHKTNSGLDSLLKPATLDLATHIGMTLATMPMRDLGDVLKRERLNRIAARLDIAGHRRMCAAYDAASKLGRAPRGWDCVEAGLEVVA